MEETKETELTEQLSAGEGEETPVDQAQGEPAPAPEEKEKEESLRRQARELVEAFPELRGKQAPPEVIRAAMEGKDLTAAYARHALAHSRTEQLRLERELAAERNNAASAARAPVKGVSGGGAVNERGRDPFLTGFLAD